MRLRADGGGSLGIWVKFAKQFEEQRRIAFGVEVVFAEHPQELAFLRLTV